MTETLVLTWTIAPQKDVAWSLNLPYSHTLDPLQREKVYYETIKYYIKESKFWSIVFCDNSNYDFWYSENLYEIAKKFRKKLELLRFMWDTDLSTKISYWAGEAEILDYIYMNSKLVHESGLWVKITWRYIVKNINDVIDKLDWVDCYFCKYWVRTTPFHVATSFFKISNRVYGDYIFWRQVTVFKMLQWNNSMKQLEQVRYILLRDYILDYYVKTDIPKIPIIISGMLFDKNNVLLFLFKIAVSLWFLSFNSFYGVMDEIFLSKQKKDIINQLKSIC